jgi:hypothetical protein
MKSVLIDSDILIEVSRARDSGILAKRDSLSRGPASRAGRTCPRGLDDSMLNWDGSVQGTSPMLASRGVIIPTHLTEVS